MPAAPPTPALDRPPFECRVRFPARLRDAAVVPAGAPLAPARRSDAPRPQPLRAAPPAPPAPPPAPAPAAEDDAARQREAERAATDAALRLIGRSIGRSIAALREDQAGRLKEWQRAAIELAVTIATRLLHDRVAAGEFPMEAKVRDMLAQLEGGSPAAVYLNPADLDLLASRLGGHPLVPGPDAPRLLPDPNLGRGDCRAESREAVLVSDITRELQEIRDDLLRSFGNARA